MTTYQIEQWLIDGDVDYKLDDTLDGRHPTIELTPVEVAAFLSARAMWEKWQERLHHVYLDAMRERDEA